MSVGQASVSYVEVTHDYFSPAAGVLVGCGPGEGSGVFPTRGPEVIDE